MEERDLNQCRAKCIEARTNGKAENESESKGKIKPIKRQSESMQTPKQMEEPNLDQYRSQNE